MHKDAVETEPYLRVFIFLLFIGGALGIIYAFFIGTLEKIRSSFYLFAESVVYVWVAVRFNEVLKVVDIMKKKEQPSIPRLMEYSSRMRIALQAVVIGFFVVLWVHIIFNLIA